MRLSTIDDYKERVLRVLVHIQENLDRTMDLSSLADLAHFSPYHFHRVFRGMTGESVKSHIRRLRLERAATRLKLGRRSVGQLATEAGYDSHEAFTRAFRSSFGTSPSSYREGHESDQSDPTGSGIHFDGDGGPTDFEPRPCDPRLDARIESLEPMRLAFVRHVGPYPECGAAWDALLPWLGKEGLIGAQTRHFGICHDDPEITRPEMLRYDACVTVDDDFRPVGNIGVQTIEGGPYAVTTHIGPYDRLGDTYTALLGQWIPRSGRELRSAPCLEAYLNDPEGTDPEDLLTDLFAPVEAD